MDTARVTVRRLPGLAVTAWAFALGVLAVLAVAVVGYLSGSPSGHPGSSSTGSMQMSTSDALYRAGSHDSTLGPLLGSRLITAWQLDAVSLAVLVLVAAWYLTGVSLVGVRHAGMRWPVARTASFMAGLAVCGIATNASIAVYDQVLFSAHMLGHLALVMLAPALLVAGRPLTLAVTAARDPRRIQRVARGRVISMVTAPPVALACYAAVIVGSHLTGVMDTIMRVTWAGQVEHLVYVLVGCQFFALVVGDEPFRWRLATPPRWLMLAIAMAVDTFTGVVLLQGTRPIAMTSSPSLPVDALSDTRTGGAIMWFGGDGIMAVVMVILVIAWLRRPDLQRRDEMSWAEQARRATFTAHTGAPAHAASDDAAAPAGFRACRHVAYMAGQMKAQESVAVAGLETDRERRVEVVLAVGAKRDVGIGVLHAADLRQPTGDDLGDLVELTHPDDRDQVDVAGDRKRSLARRTSSCDLDPVGLDGDHDDRGDHAVILSGQIRKFVGGSDPVVGVVAEVEAGGAVQGVLGGACEGAGGQDRVFVVVVAGAVDRESPAGG